MIRKSRITGTAARKETKESRVRFNPRDTTTEQPSDTTKASRIRFNPRSK